MYNYYCKNCNNIVGKWNNKYKDYDISTYCDDIISNKYKSIFFLDCKNCDKFVGLECWDVCENCFGEKEIIGEKNLFNWFLKYKKIVPKFLNCCKICNNNNNFRFQIWFFEELTFYK